MNRYLGIHDRTTGEARVGISVNEVRFIAADAKGNFWLSMAAGGIVVVDDSGNQVAGDGVL